MYNMSINWKLAVNYVLGVYKVAVVTYSLQILPILRGVGCPDSANSWRRCSDLAGENRKASPPPIMFSERSLITETQIIQVATMNISQLSPETHKIQVAISNITLLLVRQCMFIYSMFISLRRRSKIINDFIYNQRVHKFQSPPPPPPLLWQNVTIFILSQ